MSNVCYKKKVVYACPLSSRDGLLVCSYTWLTFPLSHAQWILPKGTHVLQSFFFPPLLFFCSVFSVKVLHNIHHQSYNNYWVDCRGRCSSAAKRRTALPRPLLYVYNSFSYFFTRFFFSSEKSFKREWKMAAIWQLSPKVSASMVFCLALVVWRQEDSNRGRVSIYIYIFL